MPIAGINRASWPVAIAFLLVTAGGCGAKTGELPAGDPDAGTLHDLGQLPDGAVSNQDAGALRDDGGLVRGTDAGATLFDAAAPWDEGVLVRVEENPDGNLACDAYQLDGTGGRVARYTAVEFFDGSRVGNWPCTLQEACFEATRVAAQVIVPCSLDCGWTISFVGEGQLGAVASESATFGKCAIEALTGTVYPCLSDGTIEAVCPASMASGGVSDALSPARPREP